MDTWAVPSDCVQSTAAHNSALVVLCSTHLIKCSYSFSSYFSMVTALVMLLISLLEVTQYHLYRGTITSMAGIPNQYILLHIIIIRQGNLGQTDETFVTRSRKRGHFPQNTDCELDVPADSAKSAVHARENRLMPAHHVPKLQSLSFILVFTLVSRYLCLFQSCSKASRVSVYYRK